MNARDARRLRTVFFGTTEFAVPSLRALAAVTDCRLVVTQPDRPAKRGHRLQPTPVNIAARALGITVVTPQRVRDAFAELAAVDGELYAVAAYGNILPQTILDLPRLGALNVHPSLLPLYRGATPLQSALRDGVHESGITIIAMDAGMDTGDIVLQGRYPVGERETFGELHDRFAHLGAEWLARAVALAGEGTLTRTAQPAQGIDLREIASTLTRPLTKADLEIDWRCRAQAIADRVRSLAPQPAARGRLETFGETVKILSARVASPRDGGQLLVPCGANEMVVLERVIPPNRKEMSGTDYLQSRQTVRS